VVDHWVVLCADGGGGDCVIFGGGLGREEREGCRMVVGRRKEGEGKGSKGRVKSERTEGRTGKGQKRRRRGKKKFRNCTFSLRRFFSGCL
jgi:hypothetical protein